LTENRKRNIQIKFWVNEDEYKKVIEKVRLSKMQIGRYLRNASLKKEIVIYDLTSIFELSAQVSKIGNNINQIAKKLNQGGRISGSELSYLYSSLENINNVLMDIYNDVSEKQE
jgi:hypothetical protein